MLGVSSIVQYMPVPGIGHGPRKGVWWRVETSAGKSLPLPQGSGRMRDKGETQGPGGWDPEGKRVSVLTERKDTWSHEEDAKGA